MTNGPLPLSRRLALLSALLTFALLAALRGASVALAHAHYDHSTPAIGQVLPSPPSQIDIYTDSAMRKITGSNVIMVTGPDGSRVDDGNTVVDDANRQHFSIGLNPGLPPGRYVVSFQTLSDVDGDTDHGRFSFYVGAGPTAEQKQEDAQLNYTGPVPASAGSSSGSPNIALLAGAGAVLLTVLVTGGIILGRKRRVASE